ncbi:LLM class flavin-dependent oxidoreductase [Streptomyces sp. AC602_WCS936]|uniref:LLM class flavin-dependent oxidoreductase n=1 Tax=Streptomyces sp. AC602_WCS936 TaxID=2823685 RepID=UPI001C2694DE|nr:LLM class flavin-dependent oxidoreductase [Streptomyces sp. AC602_WCS936]
MTAPLLIGRIPAHGPTAPPSLADVLRLVRAAETAGFDAVVLDDGAGADGTRARFEATTLAAAVAAATDRIGLITAPLPADQAPYHVARITASLDHLAHGRTGWLAGPADADGRTAELIEVARGLWDSFDDDAFVHDRADGLYWRLDGIHRLDHKGRHFDVAGPLNVARPPQGHPVVAVTDPAPARHADLVLLGTEHGPGTVRELRHGAPLAKVLCALPSGADARALLAGTAADGLVADVTAPDSPSLGLPRELGTVPAAGAATEPRTATSGPTLRARLGLVRPASRHARTSAAA